MEVPPHARAGPFLTRAPLRSLSPVFDRHTATDASAGSRCGAERSNGGRRAPSARSDPLFSNGRWPARLVCFGLCYGSSGSGAWKRRALRHGTAFSALLTEAQLSRVGESELGGTERCLLDGLLG